MFAPETHDTAPPPGAAAPPTVDEALVDGMPRLIQAGMGIRVSSWRLANATARRGALGVVSHVALRHVVVEEVRRGDADALSAAEAFPIASYRDELLAFAPGGPKHRAPVPMDNPDPRKGAVANRLSVIAAFVEVYRAKQGHRGKVGINVMWKCTLTVLPSIYGAMLAGVDALLCGAGVPMELPDIVRRLRAGEDLCYAPLHGTGTNARLAVGGDGAAGLLEAFAPPKMIPILSNFAFPKRILDVWEREHDGARPFAFVLENHAAGGHNAPPRNKTSFSEQDDIDAYFEKVRALGVPVYVAGAFEGGGTAEDFRAWRGRGAYGLQVGSRFALCDDSGLRRDLKDGILERNHALGDGDEPDAAATVTDARVSPTGYPFKLVPLPGTVADADVYADRKRICNKGYLLQGHYEAMPDGTVRERYVCPAMPARQYARLGGDPADTEGRLCLCNGLLSSVGFDSDSEPPLLTLGKSGEHVVARHTARDVIADILGEPYVAEAERSLALHG
ncbi:MAG TPA: hypothetical protein VM490_01590 [Armatimonadaceae bacterium]|nr:hypothetical protein [Armatimonadaceae bacterium]